MNIRIILLFLTAVTLGGTLLLYVQEKPTADVVFSADAHLLPLTATAISFSAPKGTKRIRLTTESGTEFFTDCLAIPFVCAEEAGIKHPVKVLAYELSSNVIWPIFVTAQGHSVVTDDDSRRMYELYLEQEMNMYLRLGLSLAAVFIFYIFKIGREQNLPPSDS
ncbi:MAG: hypothetical protein D3M94_14200 [Rhodocyclales bacterium GT-UBC]|nr:MAG: hypothetical protein D3M94_14200 [Rhodocyclales bacterium GT-UBC]